MNQRLFPIWFRAYVIIPVLAVLYVAIPSRWDFSPHVLTHSMPYFLVGATDWGVSNIYAFTKIAYWIGILLGGSANALCAHPDDLRMMQTIRWRLRLNAWHFGAALCLPVGTAWLMQGDDMLDMWLLAGYLVAGALGIILMLSHAQRCSWPMTARVFAAIIIGAAWGFVPVSFGRP